MNNEALRSRLRRISIRRDRHVMIRLFLRRNEGA